MVVEACRPNQRAAGGKSDPDDACMLVDILRTNGQRFRPLPPSSAEFKALRVPVRGRHVLAASRGGLANRLRNMLDGFCGTAAPQCSLPQVARPIITVHQLAPA